MDKALDVSFATARVAPELMKVLPIPLDTTLRRSAVKPRPCKHTTNQKKGQISRGDQYTDYLQGF